MKLQIKKIIRHRFLIGIPVLVLAVIIIAGVFVVLKDNSSRNHNKTKNNNKTVHSTTHTGRVLESVNFTEETYKSYLALWDKGEKAFINTHKSFFTEAFFKRVSTKSERSPSAYMFCAALAHKPDSIIISAGSVSSDKKQAGVYLTAIYQGNNEVYNLPIQLKFANNSWAIDSLNCDSI